MAFRPEDPPTGILDYRYVKVMIYLEETTADSGELRVIGTLCTSAYTHCCSGTPTATCTQRQRPVIQERRI